MGSICIYQGMGNRIINGKCSLNNSQCGYRIRLVEVINSAFGERSENVLRLLGKIPHEMLSALALVVRAIKMTTWAITMIFHIVTTRLGKLDRITRRCVRGMNKYNTGSLFSTVRARVSHLLCCCCYY